MVLKLFRACRKEIGDQAETFPNREIRGAMENFGTSSPRPQDGANGIILHLARVIITRILALFRGKTIPGNGIGKVTPVSPSTVRLMIYAVVLLSIGVTIIRNGGGGFGMFFVVSSAALFLLVFSMKQGFFIRTTGVGHAGGAMRRQRGS